MMDWNKLVDHLAAWVAAGAAIYNAIRIRSLHVIVNSRLTRLLRLTKTASFAEGQKKSEEDKK
jgi:hypothetical protein